MTFFLNHEHSTVYSNNLIRFNAEKDFFTNVADKFTEVATFTLGCGNDSFPDAWGHFKQVDNSPFTLFTQSKKTITGGKFTTEDLEQQIGYLDRFTHDWILFVITDGMKIVELNVLPAS
jgi:hypothetical protein